MREPLRCALRSLLEVSRGLECQLPTEVTCLWDTPCLTSYTSLSHSLTPLLGFLGSPPMLTIVCKSLSQDILGNPAKVWSLAKPSITLFFARRPSVFPYPTTSISTVPICHENFPDPSHILAFPLWIPQSTQLNIFLMPLIFCKF